VSVTSDVARDSAVRAVIAEYAHAIDSRDLDACIALFSDEASLVVNGELFTGRDAIRGWLDSLAQAPPGLHLTANTLVREDGERLHAISEFAFVRRGDAGWSVIAAGRYTDTFREEDGALRFLRREVEVS
jgi:ketosteroid isomerase-like protein